MDGVIAINATAVADLLALLGPVELASYDRTFTAENFIFEAQKISQNEHLLFDTEKTSTETPKAFLGELAPQLLERLKEANPETLLSVLSQIQTGLIEKDIQLYFSSEEKQRHIATLGWDGAMRQTSQDYLSVVHTNLGGGKTDGVMQENIKVDVDIQENGQIINTVTISRLHRGLTSQRFEGVHNVDYLRVYVPRGSTLLSAEGFEIPTPEQFEIPLSSWESDDDVYFVESTAQIHEKSGTSIFEESGKTVFGNWVQTKPGEMSVTTFQYLLPFTVPTPEEKTWKQDIKTALGLSLNTPYSLLVQKQSGVLDRKTHIQVHAPSWLKTLWTSDPGSETTISNETDHLYSVLFESL